MGSCIRTGPANKNQLFNGIILGSKNQSSQIGIIPSDKTLIFNHSSLQSCQFLFKKLSGEWGVPEEINLSFMLIVNSVKVAPQHNTIEFMYINQAPLNIYVCVGGFEEIFEKNLTAQFVQTEYRKIVCTEKTSKEGQHCELKFSSLAETFAVIFEPIRKQTTPYTLFMLYRFLYTSKTNKHKLLSQQLQWAGLQFTLNDIYGASSVYNVSANEECLVCLATPSNVILTPCRHMCICDQCLKGYQQTSNLCPLCRTYIKKAISYK